MWVNRRVNRWVNRWVNSIKYEYMRGFYFNLPMAGRSAGIKCLLLV